MTQDVAKVQDVRLLRHAFRSFDRAAATLEEAYRALRARLEQTDLELAAANDALRAHLREKEEIKAHLEAILESLPTGVLVADEREVVVRCNGAAEALLGVPRERLLGRPLATVLAEAGLAGGSYPLAAPTGAALSLSRTTLRGAGGGVAGSLVLLHDISTVRQLEERLQRRSRLAAMGEMVSRIAHEIRNPLGSIELFASLLRRDLARDPDRQRYADHIGLAVKAMDGLLANLLGYTQPSRPRARWHGTEALVRDALALATHGLARTPIEVVLAVDPAATRIWCDAAQVTQALLNVILNAVQAMPGGGTLTIAASAFQERVGGAGAGAPVRLVRWTRVALSDTGVGIPPDALPRIFDPFFTTRERGTGLGLAIVHAVAEGHGGRVEVESTVGRGTTVVLLLPGPAEPAGAAAVGTAAG
ncbi:two-component system sensor histidine kinase NtrB [Nitrospira sp. Kam-Ns4a]